MLETGSSSYLVLRRAPSCQAALASQSGMFSCQDEFIPSIPLLFHPLISVHPCKPAESNIIILMVYEYGCVRASLHIHTHYDTIYVYHR
jgi:hypothetical protein